VQLQARLIDDLLDLTRVARGKLNLNLKSCDAHSVIRNAIETASSAVASKKLKVSTKLHAKEHYILADCIRLQQVFLEFDQQRGEIHVTRWTDRHPHLQR
jgi:hypothetical protein